MIKYTTDILLLKSRVKIMVRLKVPATSANLGPGFDCLGIALKLYNNYIFKKIEKGVKFNLKNSVTGEKINISLEDNLTYKAIKNTFQLNFGIEIKGEISVPVARGLGSSATAIIAGIAGANMIMGQPLTNKEILNKAIEIEGHPDNIVPAFKGGFNINLMTNDGLINKKISIDNNIKIVLVIPEFKISTSELREVLPKQVDYNDAIYNHSRTALLTSCFYEKDWDNLARAMEDKLHQDYRAKYIPGFHELIETAYLKGARGVALSGSGPTIIAFADNNYDKIGKAMVNIFKKHDINSKYIVTETDNEGLKFF